MLRLTVSVTRGWAGGDDAILTEPTSNHANSLKTRRLPPVGCTLCWVLDERKTHWLFKITLPIFYKILNTQHFVLLDFREYHNILFISIEQNSLFGGLQVYSKKDLLIAC